MPRIVKNSAILEAEELETQILVPAPGGEPTVVAQIGDYALWKSGADGPAFAGFATAQEVREKHKRVV